MLTPEQQTLVTLIENLSSNLDTIDEIKSQNKDLLESYLEDDDAIDKKQVLAMLLAYRERDKVEKKIRELEVSLREVDETFKH